MLGKRMALLSLAAMTLLSFACSQTLAEASVSEEETKHIETVVDGSFFRLNLNADVAVPKEGSQIEIYTTDYARADDAKWKLMFFGSEDASVIDEWAGWDLKQNQVYYPELEHKYSAGSVFTHYDAYETGLRVDYKYIDITIWWSYSQKDAQAEGIQTSPDKAKELAQEWITRLSETIGWGDMVFNACYALPAATSGVQPGITLSNSGVCWAMFLWPTINRRIKAIPPRISTVMFCKYMSMIVEYFVSPVFIEATLKRKRKQSTYRWMTRLKSFRITWIMSCFPTMMLHSRSLKSAYVTDLSKLLKLTTKM
jgi:hypothetical protein